LQDFVVFFFFSSRRRHTRCLSDWSSDVCSSDLVSDPKKLSSLLDLSISQSGVFRSEDYRKLPDRLVHATQTLMRAETQKLSLGRSEERRVGKECRSRWAREWQRIKRKIYGEAQV